VAVSGETIHVVKSGETLQDISSRYYRTTRKWPQIRDANPGINVNNLRVGTRLRIPDAVAGNTGGAGAAASAPGVAGTDPVAPAPPLFLPAPDLMPPPPPVSQPPLEAPSRLPGLDEPGFGGGQPPPPPPPPGFGG
jgi:phage tail protein X